MAVRRRGRRGHLHLGDVMPLLPITVPTAPIMPGLSSCSVKSMETSWGSICRVKLSTPVRYVRPWKDVPETVVVPFVVATWTVSALA